MSLRKTLFKGLAWVYLLRASTRALAIVKIAIVARILSPEQVGLYSLAFLVISLLEVFTETGVNVVLIQEKKKLEEYVDTAWLVSIARGVVISAVIVLGAGVITSFFNTPELYTLLLLVAAVPFLRGFINPSLVKLQQQMNFKSDFWIRFIIFVVDAVVGVAVTWATRSPAGLIWGLIAGVIVEIVLTFAYLTPRPKLAVDFTKAKEIINKGKSVTGTGIFQYLFREGDDVFVGKVLGEGQLGIYQYAYKLATLPISEVADVFGKVAFPLYVSIAEDNQRLRKVFLKSTFGVLALVLPFAIVLIVFSNQIVDLLLGDQWGAVSPILKIVAVYSLIRAGIEPAIRVMLAKKHQNYTFYITFLSLVIMFALIYPLSNAYGLVGVGLSTVISSLLTLPLVAYLVYRILRDE